MPKICDHNGLSAAGSDSDISEIDPGGLGLMPFARGGWDTGKANECRQEESNMKLAERDLFAAEFGVLITECWLLAYAHDICPSRAWKGGQEKISLRLFHGELAGRMDLEQAGLSAGYLYEGLSYDRC